MRHEQHEQLFLDGLHEVDIPRIIGHNQQRADFSRLQETAQHLGSLLTDYALHHREMLSIRITRGVDENSKPTVRIDI